MSNFNETKKKLLEECGSSKKNHNETLFNELATALLNDPDYEKKEIVTKQGEQVEVVSTPIKDLRKSIIGSVARAAGADSAEQEKIVAEHQFPKLPMYDFVDSALKEYMAAGKKFQFSREENFQGSIEYAEQKACIKDVKRPGSTESKKQRQGDYIKLKAKSTCPDNLREDL